ncbi:aldo-keto reductase-like protein, partial [Leptotrombidium deliense]
FNAEQISRIINNCAIKPVMLQVECHPYFNQSKLIEFCLTKEILVTAFGALGSPQRPWLSQTDTSLLEEPLLGKIGQKYKKTIAQVLIRYQLQRGVVVIPKSINASRIKENFDVFDFNLSFDEMKSIDSLDRNRRLFELAWCKEHKYYPYNISF